MIGPSPGSAAVRSTVPDLSLSDFMIVGRLPDARYGVEPLYRKTGHAHAFAVRRTARGRKGLILKLVITVLLAACVSGCLGSGGNIPHEDSAGSTPRNEGAPLCRDGTAAALHHSRLVF